MKKLLTWAFLALCVNLTAQEPVFLITAEQVFDGHEMHQGWAVTVQGNRILAVGPVGELQRPGQTVINGGEATVMPGMIEGHSHLLLHPYNETSWNDQVLRESMAERIARATVHARKTVEAGFTTVRDLGTEGAGYADIGLKQAIEKKVITGPRMVCAGPAMVATGSYGPKGFQDQVDVPQGAVEVDGENLIREVRTEIGHGVDVIKVYADYRWGRNGEAMPTFSEEELRTIVETAHSAGRYVVAHASTKEGMLRAIRAGVRTIEHGDDADREVLQAMLDHQVALCPTLAAPEAILEYRGWKKGTDPTPERIDRKRGGFQLALNMGVPIVAGGDVGVFSHGDNARELDLMVEYGMAPMDVLRSVTEGNAYWLDMPELGALKPEYLADIILVQGNPAQDIHQLHQIKGVMLDGQWILKP